VVRNTKAEFKHWQTSSFSGFCC